MAPVFINLIVFAVLLFGLFRLQGSDLSLSVRVFVGLILGTLFGIALQLIYEPSPPACKPRSAGSTSSATAMSSCCR